MAQNQIVSWLTRKKSRGISAAWCYAIVTILGGIIVTALTFCFIFVAAKAALLSAFPLWPITVTLGSALLGIVLCGLIFADSLLARRDDMSFLPGWLLREYINIGPRLILEGWPHFSRAKRFAQLDLDTCADVLTYLSGKAIPTFRNELQKRFPDADWSKLKSDLTLLPGVIFFRPHELKVSLTTPLRLELRALLAQQEPEDTNEPEQQSVPVEEPHALTPEEILGVLPSASLAQIKSAYRNRIKECHPDRFAGMDEHSRSLAEEWTKSLNAAYETLLRETRGQSSI